MTIEMYLRWRGSDKINCDSVKINSDLKGRSQLACIDSNNAH